MNWVKLTFQSKVWTVELREDKKEFRFSDGFNCYYGYHSEDYKKLYLDVPNVPKYLVEQALRYAKRNNLPSIYS